VKAIRIHEHGGLDVLKYEDVPVPEIGSGEALIRVKACALNYLDIWVRRGLPGLKLPHIPGCDIAGTLEALGEGVQGYEVGERVVINPGVSCGECEYCRRGEDSLCDTYHIIGEHVDGGYAEFAKVPARNLMRIPEGFSFEEAAAAPLVFQTAWRALISRAGLRPGEDVLILGAGGGVGTACVQIAKLTGARVFAVAGTGEKLEKLKELGADELINYTEADFGKEAWRLTNKRGVDVVVDSIGEATWEKSLRALAKDGRLVTFGATSGPMPPTNVPLVFWRQLRIIGTTMGNRNEFFDVMKLIWDRKLQPIVDRVFPLSEAAEAQRLMEARQHFGKLVLVPEEQS
jgi:NADPH:quinone reductase-like Zn-dependent oxidoreductase